MPGERELRVIVVGAGFGGIAATIELNRHGFGDVTVLDRADQLGGTWHHNRYPGAACDVPSPFYSYSYAQGRDWSRLCSPQEEILDYMGGVARDFGVAEQIVPGSEVTSCAWDEDARNWTVTTATGAATRATPVILATGSCTAWLRRRGLDSSPGTASTPPSGTMTTTCGQARRGDRHGRERRAVRPGDRPGGGAARRLPAHGQLVHAAQEPALPEPLRTLLRKVPVIQSSGAASGSTTARA